MNLTCKVGDLKRIISESSNEFKAVIGPNVEKENGSNSDKAYKDAKKRAKDYDGGLNKEVGEEKAKYEKDDFNKTTLDYTPSNADDKYRKRVHAQVKGYSSEAEMNNGIEKAGDFSDNENIYQGIKKSGKEYNDNEKKFKKSGLQSREWPDETFDKNTMYESKDGFDMRQMISRMKSLQENFNSTTEPVNDDFTMALDKIEQQLNNGEKIDRTIINWLDGNRSKMPMELIDKWDNLRAEVMNSSGLMNENKNIKTVYFKKTTFLTEEHMLSRIPDEFKSEGQLFRMKDKTENEYLVEWKNNKGVIVEHKNNSGLNESLNRMKSLYEFKSSDTKTNRMLRENENETNFNKTLNSARNLK